MSLVLRARLFATAAHAAVGQRRKYTGEPYIVHPEAVATLVAAAGGTDRMVAAAWLHDVVEDTEVTIEQIEAEFGTYVATVVDGLTDRSTPADGNRAARKALDRRRLAGAGGAVQTIKVADLIDNTASIVKHDEAFARVYLREKELLLLAMTRADGDLWGRAYGQLQVAMQEVFG